MDRLYTSAFNTNKSQPHFDYIFDPNSVIQNTPSGPITGAWRPAVPTDFQQVVTVNLTGAGVNVQNVAVTGGSIGISNQPNVFVNGGYVGLTGQSISVMANITGQPIVVSAVVTGSPNVTNNGGFVGITGNVLINSGTFAANFGTVTAGQAQIAAGSRSYTINAVSGNAWINGVGPFISPITVKGGSYTNLTTSNAINFGTTGGYIVYSYEV